MDTIGIILLSIVGFTVVLFSLIAIYSRGVRKGIDATTALFYFNDFLSMDDINIICSRKGIERLVAGDYKHTMFTEIFKNKRNEQV